MTDYELLREYVEQGKEAAFRALVDRYLNLVYGAAFRQSRDATVAEEVAQNVFTLLAQRAPFFIPGDLGGWLHKTTLFKAKERYREESRRQRREALAIELGSTMKTSDPEQSPLSEELDNALLQLRERDRRVLLLRFFEEKSLAEVGAVLGISEDTAQKRVAKALDELATVFRRFGHAVPTTAVVAAALRQSTVAAPIHLFKQIATQTLLTQGATGSLAGASLILAKIMSVTKTQIAATCIVLASSPIAYQWNTGRQLSAESFSLEAQLVSVQERLAVARQNRALPQSPSRNTVVASTTVQAAPRPAIDPFIWSANSDSVYVPKSLLPKIAMPALGEDGSITADMARALELDERQIQWVNGALGQFYQQYHALENAHFQVSTEHPTSMKFSPVAEQVSLIRDDFTEEYAPVLAKLKESVDNVLGADKGEYFWKNADRTPALSEREAAVAKRVTLVRPEKDEEGGGPYYYGQEYRTSNGGWASASIRPVRSPDEVDLPQVRAVVERWKREYLSIHP